MSTGLWRFPLSTSLVRANVEKLVDTLEECDLQYWWSLYPDLVIWILVIGACCTTGPGRLRASLVKQLEVIAVSKGVIHKDTLVCALKRIIWMDGAYERQLPHLWKEVLRLDE
jgi:hypothetical protein